MFYQSLKIFISSPGDVLEERAIAEKVIEQVDRSCRDTLGVHVEAHTWTDLPPFASLPERTIQQVINDQLRDCNAFLLILNKRYGSIEANQAISNTEREIELARKMFEEGSLSCFLSYFRDLPANEDPGSQEDRVRRLRADLFAQRKVLCRHYADPGGFREKFTHDLYCTILKLFVDDEKQKALKKFWRFGFRQGQVHPQLAILYPALDRTFMRQETPDQIWLKRLVPHVVFEDFKAMQKIEKALRLIGFRDFESFNISARPPDVEDQNRLWLCLPRNPHAQRQLEHYRERAWFSFGTRGPDHESYICWRSGGSKQFRVNSPLAKYLEIQRAQPGGDWQHEHGQVFAKDFAILARFSDRRKWRGPTTGTLKDFFVAGIRGLGTWGAAWFIDRRYDALADGIAPDDTDIQLLLEVTYQNERILDVRPVSDEPESYFLEQNSRESIRAQIATHTGRRRHPNRFT